MLSEIASAVVLPGWAARDRRPYLASVLLVLGVGAPVALIAYTVASGRNWVALSLDAGYLAWLMVALAVAVVSRLVAVGEVWRASGRGGVPSGSDVWSMIVVVAVCAPLTIGIVQVGRARASISPAFTGSSNQPLFDAAAPLSTASRSAASESTPSDVPGDATPVSPAVGGSLPSPALPSPTSTTSTTTTTTPPPLPERPSSGIDPALLADVSTVMLLGGDAGPGRAGLRTDTIILLSVHRPSGRAALISVPRNLERLLFPPGSALEARFPYGFGDIANAVYPYVSYRRDMREAYRVDGVRPGVVAIAHGVGYSLDVTIDDYVLIDMQGFIELIDALGGVTVDVPKQVPMPGNLPGAAAQYPETIGPGLIEMDGTTALGYVRSRKGDTDYHRARRQRDVLAALATQVSMDDVVFAFGEVASAVGATIRTSLSPDELAETVALIGGESAIVESVGLVPPLVDVRRPDYGMMARIVAEVQLALVTGEPSGY